MTGRRRPYSLHDLSDLACAVGRDGAWVGAVSTGPQGRSDTLLLADDDVEVWVLGWWPGQSVELHSHGTSDAGFTVVTGSLVEITVGPGRLLARRELTLGAVRTVAAGARHDVLNVGSGPAVSVHAYSPRLRTMNFFDPVTHQRTRTETYNTDPADAVFTAEQTRRFLDRLRTEPERTDAAGVGTAAS